MKIKIPIFDNSESEYDPRTIRMGLILGSLLYGSFAFLDIYAAPSGKELFWFIRFGILFPLILASYFLSFHKHFYQRSKIFLFFLLSLGQFGILIMIALSTKGDLAFNSYYAGLILILLWASFVFMLSFSAALYISISTIILYNLIAIFSQKLTLFPGPGIDSILLNNNFFLISSATLSIIGAYQLEKKDKHIKKAHDELLNEKVQLELAKQRAEESDKLKTLFLANMSHEIRTPMNGILGFADLLKNPDLSEHKQKQYISIIEKSGVRMLNIINDLISISKVESGQMEINISETNINEQLNFLFEFFQNEAKSKGLTLSHHCPLVNAEAIISTDKEKVYAILTNLIKNAIKFTKTGKIEFGYELRDDELEFFVKDTGIGIDYAKQKTVFERFLQVDSGSFSENDGSGLGLAICKAYTEMLGGKIWLVSEPEKGSTFYFSLPVTLPSVVR